MSLSASGQSHVWHYAVSPRLSNISSKCAGCFWHCMILLLHPFNSLFSWTTWVSRCQKGKTSLDLNEARDNGILGCSGISWTVCKQSLQTDNHTNTPPLNFYRVCFGHCRILTWNFHFSYWCCNVWQAFSALMLLVGRKCVKRVCVCV